MGRGLVLTGPAGPPVRLPLGQGHGAAWTGTKVTRQVRQAAGAKVESADSLPSAEDAGGWKATGNGLVTQHPKPGQAHWRG